MFQIHFGWIAKPEKRKVDVWTLLTQNMLEVAKKLKLVFSAGKLADFVQLRWLSWSHTCHGRFTGQASWKCDTDSKNGTAAILRFPLPSGDNLIWLKMWNKTQNNKRFRARVREMGKIKWTIWTSAITQFTVTVKLGLYSSRLPEQYCNDVFL